MNQPEIIESNFEHEARYKSASWNLADDLMHGEVEWLTQDSRYPSEEFDAEVIRAFKEAGAKVSCVIKVDYGVRDYGLEQHYELTVK